jgi:hypothetical protein
VVVLVVPLELVVEPPLLPLFEPLDEEPDERAELVVTPFVLPCWPRSTTLYTTKMPTTPMIRIAFFITYIIPALLNIVVLS